MLVITDKAKLTLGTPVEKFFLVRINFKNNPKFYSNDAIVIEDLQNDTEFLYKGSLANEISIKYSLNLEKKSIDKQSITLNVVDQINFFDLSKLYELNLVDCEIMFTAKGLDFIEAIKLYEGILNVSSVGLDNEYLSFSLVSNDDKYNKVFPPLQINSNLSFCLPTFDAEKYISESIPIVYGYIPYPGFPIPLFYDDNTTRRYAIANHNVTNDATFKVYADGIEISSSYYTKTWDSVNSIFYIQTTGTNYTNYFKGKKITCSCKGLLYTSVNPNIVEVFEHMILNYSNFSLYPDKIDLIFSTLQKQYLANFTVARFFNNISNIFDTIEELQNDFPFALYDRNLKKTILCINPLTIPYNNVFVKSRHAFEREQNIGVSKPSDIFNIFAIRYKYDALNNRWLGYKKRDRYNDINCENSYNRIGYDKDFGVLDLYSVYEDSVADDILDYLVNVFALTSYYITYKCLHSQITYELMDGILLIDEDLGIDRKKFIVINKVIDRRFVYLTFRNTEIIS
jgi:hypothetical protein